LITDPGRPKKSYLGHWS